MRFNKGDFALVEGQLVKIIKIRDTTPYFQRRMGVNSIFKYWVNFIGKNFTNWIDEESLIALKNQTTAKILY